MQKFECYSIANAHERAVRHILERGRVVTTEDGEITAETDPITLVIRNPFNEPRISPVSPYKKNYCNQYADQLINGTDADFDYNYNDLLRHYNSTTLTPTGNYDEITDQIYSIIDRLTVDPISRRACATTWRPQEHGKSECQNPPCLQHVQGWVRDNRFNMRVVFRSNDILGAAGVNMYGLTCLQEYMAKRIGVGVGTYYHDATIPHIYLKKNLSDVLAWCRYGGYRPGPEIDLTIKHLRREVQT